MSRLELLEKTLTYLSSLGLGTVGQSLWAEQLPSTPAVATAVVLTGGFKLPNNSPVKLPTIQILTRGTVVGSVFAACSSLFVAFDDRINVLSCYPGRFQTLSELGAYYRDANNLVVFTLNATFTTTKK